MRNVFNSMPNILTTGFYYVRSRNAYVNVRSTYSINTSR